MKTAVFIVLGLVTSLWLAWVGVGLYDYFSTPEVAIEQAPSLEEEAPLRSAAEEIFLETVAEETPDLPEVTEDIVLEEEKVENDELAAFLESMQETAKEEAAEDLEETPVEAVVIDEEATEMVDKEVSSLLLDFGTDLETAPVIKETVEEIPESDFAFGDFSGEWSNNDVDGSGGLVDLQLIPNPENPELVNIVINAGGGRFVPTIELTGEMTLAGDSATETSEKPLAGNVVSTLNEDGSFIFDLNVPRFPFSVVFRGQLSDDESSIEGQAFVYIDGRKAPTSAEECPGEPICHKVSYTLGRQ